MSESGNAVRLLNDRCRRIAVELIVFNKPALHCFGTVSGHKDQRHVAARCTYLLVGFRAAIRGITTSNSSISIRSRFSA